MAHTTVNKGPTRSNQILKAPIKIDIVIVKIRHIRRDGGGVMDPASTTSRCTGGHCEPSCVAVFRKVDEKVAEDVVSDDGDGGAKVRTTELRDDVEDDVEDDVRGGVVDDVEDGVVGDVEDGVVDGVEDGEGEGETDENVPREEDDEELEVGVGVDAGFVDVDGTEDVEGRSEEVVEVVDVSEVGNNAADIKGGLLDEENEVEVDDRVKLRCERVCQWVWPVVRLNE